MSQEQNLYSLRLLFDSKQISSGELEEKVKDVLAEFLPYVEIKINQSSKGIEFVLKGTLEVVDDCHHKINKKIVETDNLNFQRLLDEAGDKIRQQAYPILAEIEQLFRVFVSQAIVDIFGFDWWDNFAPADIRNKVQPIYDKHREDGASIDPLECTQFDDLVKIITAETFEWSEDRSLSAADLLKLLHDCDSIAELKNKLEDKIKKFAFWDIFSRFFEDTKKWEKIKRDINFVIKERHKVMHHRPIRLGVIKALLEKKSELLTLLDSAKPELSEQERTEARKDIQKSESQWLPQLYESTLQQNSQMLSQIKGLTQSTSQNNLQILSQIKGLTQSTSQNNLQMLSQIQNLTQRIRQQDSKMLSQVQGLTQRIQQQDSKMLSQIQGLTQSTSQNNLQILSQIKGLTQSTSQNNLQILSQIKGLTQSTSQNNLQMLSQIQNLTQRIRQQDSKMLSQVQGLTQLTRNQNLQIPTQIFALTQSVIQQNLQILDQIQALNESTLQENIQEININPDEHQDLDIQSDINDSDNH
ncbi:MAG: hypothetical protein QNJ47_13775 [Nostocaceae cyanobacterium]|nr:hypothetical protein [Nostocaceae cyanobacterium]